MARVDRPRPGILRRCWWSAILALAGILVVSSSRTPIEAHQTITSKYKYNGEVFPVFRDRCGRCHVDGGPAPMSLVSYMEAAPWGQAIREQVVSQAMPPWYADPDGPAVNGSYGLSTKELDILVTWASGGTPRSIEKTFFGVNASLGLEGTDPPPFKPDLKRWKGDKPDLALEMPAPSTLPAGTAEDTRDIVLPTGLSAAKWIKAVDLLPGDPSMVRSATISIENGPVLTAWQPGDDVVAAPPGAAFQVEAGAKLHLRVRYKKNWKEEAEVKSDRSTVGLYFTDAPQAGGDIRALALDAPESNGASDSGAPRTFGGELEMPARIVALRPSLDRPYASVRIEAALPGQERVELLRLRAPRPEWTRRYWLAKAVALPKGTKITVTATPMSEDDAGPKPATPSRLSVALDYVAAPQ